MTGNNTARKASHDEKAITFTLTLDEIDRILSENRRLRKQLEEREQLVSRTWTNDLFPGLRRNTSRNPSVCCGYAMRFSVSF